MLFLIEKMIIDECRRWFLFLQSLGRHSEVAEQIA